MSQDISRAILWLVISLAQIAQVVDIFNSHSIRKSVRWTFETTKEKDSEFSIYFKYDLDVIIFLNSKGQ